MTRLAVFFYFFFSNYSYVNVYCLYFLRMEVWNNCSCDSEES